MTHIYTQKKLCFANRLIQYSCRALWDSFQAHSWNSALIDKLKTLEYLLSSFRKCSCPIRKQIIKMFHLMLIFGIFRLHFCSTSLWKMYRSAICCPKKYPPHEHFATYHNNAEQNRSSPISICRSHNLVITQWPDQSHRCQKVE